MDSAGKLRRRVRRQRERCRQLEAERAKLAEAWTALSGQLAARAGRGEHAPPSAWTGAAGAGRGQAQPVQNKAVLQLASDTASAGDRHTSQETQEQRNDAPGKLAFDAAWYLEQYPDIAAAGIDPFQHYLEHGKKEGRFGAPPRIDYKIVDHGYDPAKETVVVVSHEASRTGAPIVALNIIEGLRTKYNVVAIMLGGGGIVDSFRQTATVTAGPIDAKYRLTPAVHPLVHEVCATYRPRYAIVNSIESREVLTAIQPGRRGDGSPRPRIRRLHPAAGSLVRGDPEGHRGRLLRAARLGQRRAPVPIPGIATRAHRAAGPGPHPEKPKPSRMRA